MLLVRLIAQLLEIYWWIIVVRALLSWVTSDRGNPVVMLLHRLTEPVLAPLRRLVPPSTFGGLDLSPVLALVAITLVRWALLAAVF